MGNCVQVQLDEIEANEVSKGIRLKKLTIITEYENVIIKCFYTCTHSVWNYYLGRFYPKAELVMITHTYKQ